MRHFFLALIIMGSFIFCHTLMIDISIGEQVHFQNADGTFSFTAVPSKGRDYRQMEHQFARFLENSENDNNKLYRTTPRNYLNYRNWSKYRSSAEWQYPYLPRWNR